MDLKIVEVDESNWYEATELRVSKEQEQIYSFPVVYWIAESKFVSHFQLLLLMEEENEVGFIVYGLDPDDQNWWIYTIMIDERYQGKGYGKTGMKLLTQWIREHHSCTKILLGHRPNNIVAAKLYESLGYVENGLDIGGEVVREYVF